MTRDFLADLQIVIIYFEIVLLIVLSIYFIKKAWKEKGEKEIYGTLTIAVCSFFWGYSTYKFFSMIWGYYDSNLIYRYTGRIFLLFGILMFIYILNRIYFKQIFKNDLYRRIYLGLLIIFTIITITLYYVFSNLESLMFLLITLLIFGSMFVVLTVRWLFTLGDITKIKIRIFELGLLMFIGGAASTRTIQYLPEFSPLNLTLSLVEIIGILLMAIGILGLPILSELDWKKKLIHLYIIHSSGLVILDHSFKKRDSLSATFVGGGLTGIAAIVKEITKSDQKLSIISQGNINIALKYGNYVNMALLIEEDLKIIHYKLQELLEKFEELFKDILPEWRGHLPIFLPAIVLIEQILK